MSLEQRKAPLVMYVSLLVLIAHLSNIIPAEISFYFSWGDLGSDNC